jgi:FkbM family methyltransferase
MRKPPMYRSITQNPALNDILITTMRKFKQVMHPNPKATTITANNVKMDVAPRGGIGIDRDLYLYKKREPILTEYLKKQKFKVALDVGANIGYYALLEAQRAKTVYAVEPVLQNYRHLMKNVKRNRFKNVKSFNYAFGDKNTRSRIFLSNRSNLCSMHKSAMLSIQNTGTQPVAVQTIDTFLTDKQQPDLIRMDVEGYEYEIIKGAKKTLQNDKLKIIMEMHPLPNYIKPEHLDELLTTLEDNNFKIKAAIYEYKVTENKLIRTLQKARGDVLPLIIKKPTYRELRGHLHKLGKVASPNVIYQKS